MWLYRKKSLKIYVLAVFFVITVFSLTYAAGGGDPYAAFSVLRTPKTPAPDFALPQVGGENVRLSDFRDKVVLLGFFKTF
jgi:hypothetical protein